MTGMSQCAYGAMICRYGCVCTACVVLQLRHGKVALAIHAAPRVATLSPTTERAAMPSVHRDWAARAQRHPDMQPVGNCRNGQQRQRTRLRTQNPPNINILQNLTQRTRRWRTGVCTAGSPAPLRPFPACLHVSCASSHNTAVGGTHASRHCQYAHLHTLGPPAPPPRVRAPPPTSPWPRPPPCSRAAP